MNVLLINGSPNQKGCTYTALCEVSGALREEGVDTEILHVGAGPVQGCAACGHCMSEPDAACAFQDDVVSAALARARNADGLVFGSPVYYAAASGQLTSFMNRLFFSSKGAFANKPGAAVVSCRRAGSTAALDQINKYMSISGMMLVGSQYWNMVHGQSPEDVAKDLEGLQTMRVLGRNMAWLMKSIEAGRAAGILPPKREERLWTNFVR